MSKRGSSLWPVLGIVIAILIMLVIAMRTPGPSPMKDALDTVVKRVGLGGIYDHIHVLDERGRELDVRMDDGVFAGAELDGAELPDDRVRIRDDVVSVLGEDGAVLFAVPLTDEARWLQEMPPGAVREEWLAARRAEREAVRVQRTAEDERAMAALERTDELLAVEVARRLPPVLESVLRRAPVAAAARLTEAERTALVTRAADEAVADLSRDVNVRLSADGSVRLVVLTHADELAPALGRLMERELRHAQIDVGGPLHEELQRGVAAVAQELSQVELIVESPAAVDPAGTIPEPPPAK